VSRLYFVLSVAAIVLTLAASAAIYSRLPEQIPTHWNLQGQVDGHGPRQTVFLMPAVMAGLLALLFVLPWLSPKQFEIDSFRSAYWCIALALMVFLAYVQGLTIWAAIMGGVDIVRALLAGMLLMFGVIGGSLAGVRRNFWVGVRTPWTIASERVWDDTHRLAARAFVVAAAVGLAVLVLPLSLPAAGIAVLALIMGAAIGPAIYSLVHYKQLQSRGEI
jgi:uncharacterized membrane protein